ncbi:MAG TPA: hypothetical protein PLP87_06120 [Clostridiales bacterium]|nr:hypothetical protein [Clostridiales bacterium]
MLKLSSSTTGTLTCGKPIVSNMCRPAVTARYAAIPEMLRSICGQAIP